MTSCAVSHSPDIVTCVCVYIKSLSKSVHRNCRQGVRAIEGFFAAGDVGSWKVLYQRRRHGDFILRVQAADNVLSHPRMARRKMSNGGLAFDRSDEEPQCKAKHLYCRSAALGRVHSSSSCLLKSSSLTLGRGTRFDLPSEPLGQKSPLCRQAAASCHQMSCGFGPSPLGQSVCHSKWLRNGEGAGRMGGTCCPQGHTAIRKWLMKIRRRFPNRLTMGRGEVLWMHAVDGWFQTKSALVAARNISPQHLCGMDSSAVCRGRGSTPHHLHVTLSPPCPS